MIVLKGHRDRVERVAFSLDGTALFAPTWQGVQMWRPFLAGGVPTSLSARHPNNLHLTPDGKGLYISGYALHYVDLATGEVAELAAGGETLWFALAHSGDRYITDDRRIGREVQYALARSTTGALLWQRPLGDWWGRPLFLPGDGDFVVVVNEAINNKWAFRIATHQVATGDEIRRSAQLASEVREWTLSPDGSLVACWYTVWVHIYALREQFDKPLATIRNDNRKEFTGIAFHPSGRYLAATSNDETVKLYDTQTWEVSRTFTWKIGKMRSIAFSPDGTLAAAGSDKGQVVVWDVDL